jgi:hypothetical protein
VVVVVVVVVVCLVIAAAAAVSCNLAGTQHTYISGCSLIWSRSQWPRDLRRRSTAAVLLGLWVRITHVAWMFVCCECCVLLGRGLCDGLITRTEESYRLWRVVVL